jgi:hypothetical protein
LLGEERAVHAGDRKRPARMNQRAGARMRAFVLPSRAIARPGLPCLPPARTWPGHSQTDCFCPRACEFADEVLDDLGRNGRQTTAARFVLGMVESAAAPTNYFLGNPAAVKQAFETGGLSLVRGTKNWIGDVVHNGGMPSTIDRGAYQVGRI